MRCAVVGHVEWCDFALVPRVPPAGEIVQGDPVLSIPAGGGAVVARQVAQLNGGRCEFFTALGEDELGHRAVRELANLGLDVHAQHFGATRRGWVHVDANGERTITVIGPKLLPQGPLPLEGYDLVFFVAGDTEALRSARAARFLAGATRELAQLREADVPMDLLVGSARDPGESYDGSVPAGVVAMTDGSGGGTANGERWVAAPLPAPVVDAYGCGDSFGAALAFGLARGDVLHDALELAARAGASVLTGRGPYTSQIAS
ncbi:MAG TPA: PfkB family carbohydrate kinase [Gaiellaceae bacterium]|nr:PfkB family carbohydrate kinase [Gaiellaceae bacterium]